MKKRYYITDIREDLIKANANNKSVLNTFGRFYDSERKADQFMTENPLNQKYLVINGILQI